MIKYFELLIEFSWIQNKEYINIAKTIEINQDKNILIYHKNRYFFHYYNKLLKWEMPEEEFTKIGDVSNTLTIYREQVILESIWEINKLKENELKNSLIIIDSSAKKFSDGIDKQIYYLLIEKLKNLNSILIVL
jgi:hypothetical protein